MFSNEAWNDCEADEWDDTGECPHGARIGEHCSACGFIKEPGAKVEISLFRTLTADEVTEFRQWARANYTPGEEIRDGVWHPVVVEECHHMNDENSLSDDDESEDDDYEDEPDLMPVQNYAVVEFGGSYAVKPMRYVKEGEDHVVTTTQTMQTAEAYLDSLLDEDDDPQCVCGVYRSEHSLCGCREGFQTAGSWAVEREFIVGLDDDMYERMYGDQY